MAGSIPNKYPNCVRVVVAGDNATGKSSLILTATHAFMPNVPPVLPPTKIFPQSSDKIPLTIIDTSSSTERKGELVEELTNADAVILTYACHRPETFDRLGTFWLPKLRDLEVKVPVIIAGCMLDRREGHQDFNLEEAIFPIMQQFQEIEVCLECSALQNSEVAEVFYYAQRSVLSPVVPLFDRETNIMSPRCVRALKRIFILCDQDKDGALNAEELNQFQVKCFNTPLQRSELDFITMTVKQQLPQGVNENGVTLIGFIYLQTMFIARGKWETTWVVLRKFGYDDNLGLSDNQLLPAIKRHPDQSMELTNEALEFLKNIFLNYDFDSDGFLQVSEVEDLFSTAPQNPLKEAPYRDAAEKNPLEGITLDGFLSKWKLMALLDPNFCVEHLLCIGYMGNPQSAIQLTRRRRIDCRRQKSNRNVYQCFVIGPKEGGKTALLNSFIRRCHSEKFVPDSDDCYAVNVVDRPGGEKKTLVLREIQENRITEILSKRDALSECDVAVFVHDSSCESSLRRATELLYDVASRGEATGYGVPCLFIAAKDDLHQYSTQIQDSIKVCKDLGIEAPIPISSRFGDFNDIFCRIVKAAEHPHLNIPETEAEASTVKNQQTIDVHFWFHHLAHYLFVPAVAAVTTVGLFVYRAAFQ